MTSPPPLRRTTRTVRQTFPSQARQSNVSEGSNSSFTVTLSAAISKSVTVAWTATGNTDDYSPDSGTVTFAANSPRREPRRPSPSPPRTTCSRRRPSPSPSPSEPSPLLSSSQLSLKSGASSDTATIAESDPITINISGPSSVDEGDATTAYTVSLSPSGVKPTADLTVSYATSGGTATAGN